MSYRLSFLILFAFLLVIACSCEDIDVTTVTRGELPPPEVLNSTTSVAGNVKKSDSTIPSIATVEVLFGDIVTHSEIVNTADGLWFLENITLNNDPTLLIRIIATDWVNGLHQACHGLRIIVN